MNKTIIKAFALAAVTMMAACGSDDEIKVSDPHAYFCEVGDATLKTADIELPGYESFRMVDICSNVDWSVSTDADWITLSNRSGGPLDKENLHLKVSATANETGADRTATVTLSAAQGQNATLTVRQTARLQEEEEGLTAMQIAAQMYAGINIGNTMECPGGEGDWSMPVNQDYVAALASMGFNAVRIPCSWDVHAQDGVIDAAWLERVDEIVGWVIDNGMFALLNTHWDKGWIEGDACTKGYNAEIDAKFGSYWTQIATQLNHYDQRLLFCAMNEPPVDETNTETKHKSIDAIMKYEQTMLDAVRATGGNNLNRVLVMSMPNTNFEIGTEGYYKLPEDVVADRMMVEGHFYGPYNFNMMEQDASWGKTFWYWGEGNHVEGSDRNSTWGEEAWVREQFDLVKKHYIDKGIPGITGEYCVCCNRENTPGIDRDKWRASAKLWAKVVTMESKNAGMVPFFWEVGGDINRKDGSVKNSLQLDGVLEGAAIGKYPF